MAINLPSLIVISFHGPQIGQVERPHNSTRMMLNQVQNHRNVATPLTGHIIRPVCHMITGKVDSCRRL